MIGLLCPFKEGQSIDKISIQLNQTQFLVIKLRLDEYTIGLLFDFSNIYSLCLLNIDFQKREKKITRQWSAYIQDREMSKVHQ